MQDSMPILSPFAGLPTETEGGIAVPARAADPGIAWQAARRASIAVQHLERRVLELRGPGAAEYLHRLGTREAEDMAPGDGRVDCVLTGKGKLIASFLLWRVEAERFVLETAAETADALHEFLDRFHFAEPFELVRHGADLALVGVLGPAATSGQGWRVAPAPEGTEGLLLTSDELGQPAQRLLAPIQTASAWIADKIAAGAVPAGRDELEGLRIEAGWPRFGFDADAKSIPLELGLGSACSVTKGCYPGQEVIARIHTYGHVNRSLVRARYTHDSAHPSGTAVFDEGMQAGRLTSAIRVPGTTDVLALAMLPLGAIEENDALRVASEDGPLLTIVDVDVAGGTQPRDA